MEITLALSWLVARQITGRKRPCTDYDSRDAIRGHICMCLWMPDASSLVNVTTVPVTDRERLRERERPMEEGEREAEEKNRPSRYSNLGGESCIVPRWHAAFPMAARKICAFVRICEKMEEINCRIYLRSDAFEYCQSRNLSRDTLIKIHEFIHRALQKQRYRYEGSNIFTTCQCFIEFVLWIGFLSFFARG